MEIPLTLTLGQSWGDWLAAAAGDHHNLQPALVRTSTKGRRPSWCGRFERWFESVKQQHVAKFIRRSTWQMYQHCINFLVPFDPISSRSGGAHRFGTLRPRVRTSSFGIVERAEVGTGFHTHFEPLSWGMYCGGSKILLHIRENIDQKVSKVPWAAQLEVEISCT